MKMSEKNLGVQDFRFKRDKGHRIKVWNAATLIEAKVTKEVGSSSTERKASRERTGLGGGVGMKEEQVEGRRRT